MAKPSLRLPRRNQPWRMAIGIVFVLLLLLVAGLNVVLVRGRDRVDHGCLRWVNGEEVLRTGTDCTASPVMPPPL